MATERLSEDFFTPAFRGRIAVLLRSLSPPAEGVFCLHLDAPGWIIFDENPSPLQKPAAVTDLVSAIPGDWLGPLHEDWTPWRREQQLNLVSKVVSGQITWFWEPAERCSVLGTLSDETAWPDLCKRIADITDDMRSILNP